MLKFICYPKCTTCQKAKKWLDDNKIEYELRDIKLNNPTLDELTKWYKNNEMRTLHFSIRAHRRNTAEATWRDLSIFLSTSFVNAYQSLTAASLCMSSVKAV